MSSWSEIREQARAWHLVFAPDADDLPSAAALLAAAESKSGVRRIKRPPDDVLLDGGEACYDREGARIFYSEALSDEDAVFYVAHEYGHHRLHDLHSRCTAADINVSTPAEPESSVVGEADAYSPKERAEAQANLFAREFLLPRDKLRRRWITGACDADMLAAELGLPLGLVLQQLADAILLPDEQPAAAKHAPPPPDPSQQRAATVPPGPHQVRAGPGTGKTRALIARIKWLIEQKEDPASIVALTYSNDSAADLGARLRHEIGDLAPMVWTGTFHAYGLELLRKYGEAIGLPLNPKPYDRSDSLFLLEQLLPSLELEHYLDLREPLLPLKAVVNAISRAKDQHATPADYARLAAAMRRDPTQEEAGTKAAEVARIYKLYQEALHARGAVDFGDLIMRAHELLDGHPEIAAEIRKGAAHILVDEYQDMNRASALFLKLLVTPGRGPWVVGDVRQSIYRFRGASPLNMTGFKNDFPGASHSDLEINYRSGGRIVRTFEAFGAQMGDGKLPAMPVLDPKKGADAGRVSFNLASTFEAEAESIVRAIRAAKEQGGGTYREHVVLARSHTTLARIAAHLERARIPSLYFGDFFEREEIRDLLCLLSVASEKDGLGLLRIAQTEPYCVPLADIVTLCDWRRQQDVSIRAALTRLDEVEALSPAGKQGLAQLADDLGDVIWTTSPHNLILRHLFCRGRIRWGTLSRADVAGQQARLAVYQLLQIAFDYRPAPGKDPKSAFLAHIRRLEILDEEKEFRRMPAAAAGIDAVRLMTVHGSKGLEFPNVYIAALSPYYFPSPNRGNPCPPPTGLIPDDPLMGRDAEEDGLFFVALSRAEDSLTLSRALRYQSRSSPNPSRLLEPIAGHLSRPTVGTPDCTDEGNGPRVFPALQPLRPIPEELPVRAIETYQDCPREYYYSYGLGLSAWAPSSPYLGLISSVRATLSWAREVPEQSVRLQGWQAQFDIHWQKLGPVDSPWVDIYRSAGAQMMARAMQVTAGPGHAVGRGMTLGGQMITARADSIVAGDGELVIQRLKAARLAKKESSKVRYGVLVAMVAADHPGLTVRFEHVSLVDGECRPDIVKADAAGKACNDIVSALIRIQEGHFPPKTNDRRCPGCPYYFCCPADGVLRAAPAAG